MQSPVKRIASLDGLRALSILLVLTGHAAATIPYREALPGGALTVLGNARLGVMAFFVISGYLITRLLRKEWQREGRIDLRGFYLRRLYRIFPAFYAYILVVTLLAAVGAIQLSGTNLLSAFLFAWNYVHLFVENASSGTWFLGHFWTLSLEEQFYLVWPATFLLAGRRRGARIALVIFLVSPAIRVLTYFLWPDARPFITIMLHTNADPLMLGSLVALLEGNGRFETAMGYLLRHWVAAVAALFALLVSPFLSQAFPGCVLPAAGQYAGFGVHRPLSAVGHPQPGNPRGQAAQPPAAGDHRRAVVQPVPVAAVVLTPLNHTWTGLFPVNLLVCFVVAWASYRFIEQPFLQLRRRRAVPA
jgi:peptidoglycan/LPS O-acetylase OafA/YrhL